MTTQHLGLTGGKMKLLAARVDPHVGRACHHIWVAREAQTVDIKQGGFYLVGNGHVDMFEGDYIAEILGGSIVGLALRAQSRHGARRVKASVASHRTRPGRSFWRSGWSGLAVTGRAQLIDFLSDEFFRNDPAAIGSE